MLIFLIAVLILILGYVFYGNFVQKSFCTDLERETPVCRLEDGVDYVKMPFYKMFLVQFLNIAGLGPVFGALLGAVYGPVALLWIVFGGVFAGGVYDYVTARISIRNEGTSVVSMLKDTFGNGFNFFFMIFLIFFLLLVGAIFAMAPAQMLAELSKTPFVYWIIPIFAYYFIATILPIDKIIGRIYPFFAFVLIAVTALLIVKLFSSGVNFYPDLSLTSQHPKGLSVFPMMFITIACGALSGFHATQSPMIAKCIVSEKQAKGIFYGAMITESFIALVWATLGIAFYQSSNALMNVIEKGGPGLAVSEIAKSYLGEWGAVAVVFSVVLLSITTGDTAFRAARLNISDAFKISQVKLSSRLILSLFVLGGGIALSLFNLTTIWSYFGWANQFLACIILWFCTIYLYKQKRFFYITLIPALFISAVCVTWVVNLIVK